MTRRILIVDDDALIRQLLVLILTSAGYSVTEAINGRDALDKLGERAVNLVITDLRMPQMDGIELTRELRRNPSYEKLPIVMLTSDFQDYKRREAEEAGVDRWITKPFIRNRLIRTVRTLESGGQTATLAWSQA
jgi:two-component system chemotaxis response regulator CheY